LPGLRNGSFPAIPLKRDFRQPINAQKRNNETKGQKVSNDDDNVKRYMAKIGAKGGKATSAAKTAAVRRNLSKGRKVLAAKAKAKDGDK